MAPAAGAGCQERPSRRGTGADNSRFRLSNRCLVLYMKRVSGRVDEQLSRLREADRGDRRQAPGASPPQRRQRRQHARRGLPPRGQGRPSAQADLQPPDSLAEDASRPPSAQAPLFRLHRAPHHGLPAARRRPCLRRGPGSDRRARALPRPHRHDHRPGEGVRYRGPGRPQLRHGQSRRLPQGVAPAAAGGAFSGARTDPDRHAGCLSRRRRRGARASRGHRPLHRGLPRCQVSR